MMILIGVLFYTLIGLLVFFSVVQGHHHTNSRLLFIRAPHLKFLDIPIFVEKAY
jgi:hypothetical protein